MMLYFHISDVVGHPVKDAVHIYVMTLIADYLISDGACYHPEVGGYDLLRSSEKNAARDTVQPAGQILLLCIRALPVDAVDKVIALFHLL